MLFTLYYISKNWPLAYNKVFDKLLQTCALYFLLSII